MSAPTFRGGLGSPHPPSPSSRSPCPRPRSSRSRRRPIAPRKRAPSSRSSAPAGVGETRSTSITPPSSRCGSTGRTWSGPGAPCTSGTAARISGSWTRFGDASASGSSTRTGSRASRRPFDPISRRSEPSSPGSKIRSASGDSGRPRRTSTTSAIPAGSRRPTRRRTRSPPRPASTGRRRDADTNGGPVRSWDRDGWNGLGLSQSAGARISARRIQSRSGNSLAR